MPTFSADRLRRFATEVFRASGFSAEEAEVVSRSLVDANLCGHDSHGLIRIPQYLNAQAAGRLKAGAALTVLHETPAVLACDGGWGPGQVQAHRLLRRLVPKAREVGLAAGTLKHCGHVGRLGEYAEAAAAEGLALFGTVNNHGFGRAVAPPGGKTGRIGTNPLCLGVPAEPPVGAPRQSGLVPMRASVPPGGATPRPKPWLFTVARSAMPVFAAASAYSPSRPMWPECLSVPAARPSAWARGMRRSSRRCACTWPSPLPPSTTSTPAVSLTTVNGAPGTTRPSRMASIY